ncbi:hypothetical protein HOLleu_07902 [Holothuria leucospilota]|uniref:Uncharacterized protein n=1 Tax=Holothuria leucospilota TaxID=206669 RepID=A0A9Q1CIA0_HOLLE|nr:hypothetical protein HOLleu_07902 [Holothuria leucospilota]
MNDVSMTVGMEAQSHGDSIMAVCDDSRIPRPGSPADDEHGVIIFTDSDCETIMDELDTPRTEKQKKFIKSHSSNVIGSYKKEKDVILKSDQVLEFSAAIVKNGNHDTNSRKSAFSRVKHSKGKNQTILEDAVTVQSNHDHQPIQKHLDSAPTGNTSGGVPKVSSNGKGDGVSRHHGNRELVDPRNEQDDGLDDRGVKENDRTNSITKVTLNISNLESPEEGEDLEARPSRSSTNSSSSSLRDQGSQTCSEAAGDILQYPVSPRVSPATVARYSPRRITSAELHTGPGSKGRFILPNFSRDKAINNHIWSKYLCRQFDSRSSLGVEHCSTFLASSRDIAEEMASDWLLAASPTSHKWALSSMQRNARSSDNVRRDWSPLRNYSIQSRVAPREWSPVRNASVQNGGQDWSPSRRDWSPSRRRSNPIMSTMGRDWSPVRRDSSPNISPFASPRSKAEAFASLRRTPDQMVKQADRLIERTQAILERSAEAKRRTEVLLKASRERRAQERLEELASYKGERLGNSKDANGNTDHRTGASLDTNGNHEDNGYEEENSNVIPTH